MSAGHSLRRQNYNFVTVTPPSTDSSTPHAESVMHYTRVVIAVVIAVALNFATVASISIIAGR